MERPVSETEAEITALRIALRESEARLQVAVSEIAELKSRGPSVLRRVVAPARHRLGIVKHKVLNRVR